MSGRDDPRYPSQEELGSRTWRELDDGRSIPLPVVPVKDRPESRLGRPKKVAPTIWTASAALAVIEDAAAVRPNEWFLNELGFTNGSLYTRLLDAGYTLSDLQAMGDAFENEGITEDAMEYVFELARDVDYLRDRSPYPMLDSTHLAIFNNHRRRRVDATAKGYRGPRKRGIPMASREAQYDDLGYKIKQADSLAVESKPVPTIKGEIDGRTCVSIKGKT